MKSMGICENSISERPIVSVITVVLNDEEGIVRTLESVIRQKYDRIEHIVIDGGSTDGTVDVVRANEAHIDYWTSEPDKGVSDAFNKGISRSRGEIVGFLNAGDWYEEDTIDRVVVALAGNPHADGVCGALQFWKKKSREYFCRSMPHLLGREMSVAHPSTFLRSEIFKKIGKFSNDYRFAMDYELLLRIIASGGMLISDDTIQVNMQHDGISEKNWQAALKETHRARRVHLKRSFFSTSVYYMYLYIKRMIRVKLEEKGFDALLRFYRGRLAMVKKTKGR